MDPKMFQMCLDTLSTYAHIHEQLYTNGTSTVTKEHETRGEEAEIKLEELIFDIIELLHKNAKGQVA